MLSIKSHRFTKTDFGVSCRPNRVYNTLLWQGDDEFKPRMSVLFDRSIEKTLAADAIWGLVSLVSYLLLKGADYLMNNGHPSK